ncbi:nucleolar and spindle-associated protein 1-like [Montipora capricornis]|uniref:nucleolar and spindle-associated protein 1-like n=1 Tax=Montipora capricornis TaxID=246305 RepID=UPI0035F18FF5
MVDKSVKMEVTFEVNKLDEMKRTELQKLCKAVGIKANLKNAQLAQALREYAAKFPSKNKRSSCTKIQQLQETSVELTETTKTNELQKADDNESYKQQLLNHLDKKVEEKMPVECKIPRFVQFANDLKTSNNAKNKTPGAKWSEIHNSEFEKMDSIDVYLEKKRKSREFFNQSAKRAKYIGVSRKSEDKSTEVSLFKPTSTTLDTSATFVFGSPSAKPLFQPEKKEAKVSTATSATAKGKKLRSPKVVKPVVTAIFQTRTPHSRRTISVTSAAENKPKTPANAARKSMTVTPFRFSPAVNVPTAPTPTPRKKFDLKASLAKPLPYKPHTGKLKPISTYKEECRPTISESKLKGRKTDIKSARVTTREERRLKENRSRESRRANAINRHRGVVC